MRKLALLTCLFGVLGTTEAAAQAAAQYYQQYTDVTARAAVPRVLASLRGANLNVTTDQALSIGSWTTKYTVSQVIVTNCSTTPTLAAGGLYTATSKGGSAIVAAGQVYTALSSASTMLPLTLAITTSTFTASTLYFSLTTANGGALTCDIYVVGTDLT